MTNSILLKVSVVCIGIFASVGCSTLRDKSNELFVKPLASNGATGALMAQKLPPQRDLCLQTAAAVAKQGHATEAIKLFEKAEELDRKSAPLDKELASLYASVGRWEEAFVRYERLIEQPNASAETFNNFVWSLMDAGLLARAEQTLASALQKFPANERLMSTQAVLQLRRGNAPAALATFHEIYGPAVAHHNMAVLLIDNDQISEAASHLQQAVAMEDCPREAHELLAVLERQAVDSGA